MHISVKFPDVFYVGYNSELPPIEVTFKIILSMFQSELGQGTIYLFSSQNY